MKRRWLPSVIAANLVMLVAPAFVYPHLMVSPGPLVRGRAELTTDCFACHAPLRGAASARCIECHALPDFENYSECHRDPSVEPDKPGKGQSGHKRM